MESKPSPKSADIVISDEKRTELFKLIDEVNALIERELIEMGVISIHKPYKDRRLTA